MGIILNGNDIENKFGVIIHEVAHSLFHSQSIQEQEKLTGTITNYESKNNSHVLYLINEALATAIGNGIAYPKIKSDNRVTPWYSDYYIDSYAKAIFKITKEYFDTNKEIDNKFIDEMFKTFDKSFPNANKNLKFNFEELVIYSSGTFGRTNDIRKVVRDNFYIYKLSVSTPFQLEQIKQTYNTTNETLLLIGSKKEL